MYGASQTFTHFRFSVTLLWLRKLKAFFQSQAYMGILLRLVLKKEHSIHMAQDRDRLLAVVNTVINLLVPH
jgi:phosphatidylglycerophosphate synthase